MAGPCDAISNYIFAKDCNRPWLLRRAFTENAQLEMVIRTEAISFPSAASGITEIGETLVRKFSLDNENIFTFCLSSAPKDRRIEFGCEWLVGMSRRDTGEVRVGCGRYDWVFEDLPRMLACNLKITIELMVVLDRDTIQLIMPWLTGLAYPWCPSDLALRSMPVLDGLKPVSDFLGRRV